MNEENKEKKEEIINDQNNVSNSNVNDSSGECVCSSGNTENIKEDELNNVINICRLNDINIIKECGLESIIINDNSLSGGEKNRIILARSLLHSKKIIILDEVLKEVDYKLEYDIISDIINYYKDKIIIYVSHKDLSSLFNKVLTFRKE